MYGLKSREGGETLGVEAKKKDTTVFFVLFFFFFRIWKLKDSNTTWSHF